MLEKQCLKLIERSMLATNSKGKTVDKEAGTHTLSDSVCDHAVSCFYVSEVRITVNEQRQITKSEVSSVGNCILGNWGLWLFKLKLWKKQNLSV